MHFVFCFYQGETVQHIHIENYVEDIIPGMDKAMSQQSVPLFTVNNLIRIKQQFSIQIRLTIGNKGYYNSNDDNYDGNTYMHLKQAHLIFRVFPVI